MSSSSKVTLHARRARFYSQHDEEAFFNWLKSLECLASFSGKGDTIRLEVTSSRLRDEDLRELIAIFTRYHLDLRQLLIFETRGNKGWLRDKRAYWHDEMFADSPVA